MGQRGPLISRLSGAGRAPLLLAALSLLCAAGLVVGEVISPDRVGGPVGAVLAALLAANAGVRLWLRRRTLGRR